MSLQTRLADLITAIKQDFDAINSGGGVYDYAVRRSASTGNAGPRLMVDWQTELIAGTGISWSAGNPTRLTVDVDGVYQLGATIAYSSATQRAQGNGELFINGVNEGLFRGDTYIRNSGSAWDYGIVEFVARPFPMVAGDYFEVGLARTSGAGANYTTGGTGTLTLNGPKCEVWVNRLK